MIESMSFDQYLELISIFRVTIYIYLFSKINVNYIMFKIF